jgi:uncharacterized damage-inducible protein DinB
VTISESLLPEFDHETANTRKVLERIPADKLDWKAHPKSNSIGWVGMHVAQIPGWAAMILQQDSLDIAPPGQPPYRTPKVESVGAILAEFDKCVPAGRAAIAAATDADFFKPWSFLMAGKTIYTMPRIKVVRNMVMNHGIHHRAHLCVYLRLNDVPVPGLYGPSGDDPTM